MVLLNYQILIYKKKFLSHDTLFIWFHHGGWEVGETSLHKPLWKESDPLVTPLLKDFRLRKLYSKTSFASFKNPAWRWSVEQFCFQDDRNSCRLLNVTRFVVWSGVVMTSVFEWKSPNVFFLLTGNTGLWVHFPQTGNISVGVAQGVVFLTRWCLSFISSGYMVTCVSSEYRAAHPIVYHVPLSELENFIFLDKSL